MARFSIEDFLELFWLQVEELLSPPLLSRAFLIGAGRFCTGSDRQRGAGVSSRCPLIFDSVMEAYLLVRRGSSPPWRWFQTRSPSSSSKRWGLPLPGPFLWLSASSGRPSWRQRGWERWRAALAAGFYRRRGYLPPLRSLGPVWARGVLPGFGSPWEPRRPLLETSEHPCPVRRRRRTRRRWVWRWMVWVLLNSAAPSSGSPPLSAGGSAEAPFASVFAASVILQLRWTSEELRLLLLKLKTNKKESLSGTFPECWLERGWPTVPESRYWIPVWLPCARCCFSCRAPGVGIDIRLLNSFEQPETSPDCMAAKQHTNNKSHNMTLFCFRLYFSARNVYVYNMDAPHPDVWPVRLDELSPSQTACPASSGRVCAVWTHSYKTQSCYWKYKAAGTREHGGYN